MADSGRHARGARRVLLWALSVCVAAAVALTVGLHWNRWFGDPVRTEGVVWSDRMQDDDSADAARNPETIAIPGFTAMTLTAGETRQQVSLHNPEDNEAYFRISLILPDGTLLWRSEFIEPGKGVREITLNEPLAAGEYPDTTVRYECFSLDDQSPLNGAVSKTTLHVE